MKTHKPTHGFRVGDVVKSKNTKAIRATGISLGRLVVCKVDYKPETLDGERVEYIDVTDRIGSTRHAKVNAAWFNLFLKREDAGDTWYWWEFFTGK